MTYWVREVGGWVLVVLGLSAFAKAYDLLLDRRIFEAAPLTFIGFVVFRGGVHVLKVAVAVRMARSVPGPVAPLTRRPPRPPGRPVGPTPVGSVVPGPKSRPMPLE